MAASILDRVTRVVQRFAAPIVAIVMNRKQGLDGGSPGVVRSSPLPTVPNSDSAGSRPLKRSSLPVDIADRMRRRILSGELPPGTRLPGHRELGMRATLRVSRAR